MKEAFITSKFTLYMFNQIIFQLLMHLPITNFCSNTHHIGDICRDICIIREIDIELLWYSPCWNSETSNWVYPFRSSSTIILWSVIHALIIFPILTLSKKRDGFLTMAKRACKTLKACSTSFRTVYWRWANKTAFGPCGIVINRIKVVHFG